ncbi:GNAT family N-acetyltransferase [Pendulispora albinea]|uniref:N-acetyltransferase n=1 Tax=Pendulispora albinea TaxID=2741071 RepID=A0ABZ2LS69_9BACT
MHAAPILIRPELPSDVASIRRVNELAFGRAMEADMVDAVRHHGGVTLSLVAVLDGNVVGHILFSPVAVDREDGARDMGVGLAPMAVHPDFQKHGVGSELVRDGLERLRGLGHGVVIVVGHPEYYPRFGFERGSRFGLRWELACPDAAFMALALREGALDGRPGVVRYRPEFGSP